MDITKELIEIETDNSSVDKFIEDIELEKYALSQKAHVLKSIALCNAIEELSCTNLFTTNKIEFLEIYWEKNSSIDDVKLCFLILNKEKERMPAIDNNHNFVPPFSMLMKTTEKFGLINPIFIKEGALKFFPKDLIVKIKSGIKEELLDILLSKELKAIVDYNNMQLELSDSNEGNTKKPKM